MQIRRKYRKGIGQDAETVSRKTGLGGKSASPWRAGTSNDGNTARRAILDPKTFSEITGVDEETIKRLAVILNEL